jgi:hypothetical protein
MNMEVLMKSWSGRATLASAALLAASAAFPSVSQADTFTFGELFYTQSNFAGTSVFGTLTITNLGGGVAQFDIEMAPNTIIQTGEHFPLTISLNGSASIDVTSFNPSGLYSVDPGSASGTEPGTFRFFNTALNAPSCSPSGSPCGSSLIFDVDNYSGITSASQLFNGNAIFAATDVLLGDCSGGGPTGGGCTGVVGATLTVPGPIVGAGVPGLILACAGLLGLARRRRQLVV